MRAAWSERFELLMVDEFQDTNPRQLAILTALERGNLFTVGDELAVDLRLPRTPTWASSAPVARSWPSAAGASSCAATSAAARRCWRSSTRSSSERFGRGYTPLVAGARIGGSERADAAEPLVELLLTEHGAAGRSDGAGRGRSPASAAARAPRWRQAEARMLAAARGRARATADGRGPGRSSCCCARSAISRSTSGRCSECGLRTLAAVGGFWGRQQVGDLLAYLRALANPLDELGAVRDARLAARRLLERRARAARPRRPRAGRGPAVGDGR